MVLSALQGLRDVRAGKAALILHELHDLSSRVCAVEAWQGDDEETFTDRLLLIN